MTDRPRVEQSSAPRGEAFYQGLLDDEVRAVPVSLRAAAAGSNGSSGVSTARYVAPEFHRAEVERMWSRVWQMACREEQVPAVGDSLVYEVGDLSLIVVRTEAGIRAFHNSCLHRGTQLRSGPGHLDRLRCPYHGFTWNLDGTLREIPCDWDFPHANREQLCLPEARVATWGGFVFVNPDPACGPLEEYLGVLPAHFAAWPLEQRYLKAHVVRVLPCNWKVALEAFIESYHVMAVHPQLLPTAADTLTEYDVYGPNVSRMVTAVGVASEHLVEPPAPEEIVRLMLGDRGDASGIERGETARAVVAEGIRASLRRRAGLDLDAATDAEVLDGIEYFVFPNFMPWGGYLTSFAYRFRPDGDDPQSCLMDVMVLERVPDGVERLPAAPTRHLTPGESWSDVPELGVFGRVFNQDTAIVRRVQRGLRSSVSGTTLLSNYQESRIRHLHATLDSYLDQEAPRPDG